MGSVLRVSRRLRELRVEDGQLINLILRGHLAEQISGAQRPADDSFQFVLKGDHAQRCVHAGAENHVLHGPNFASTEALLLEQLRREVRAAGNIARQTACTSTWTAVGSLVTTGGYISRLV